MLRTTSKHSDRNMEIISLVRRTSVMSKSVAESVPSDIVGILEMLNWPTKVCGGSSHRH